GPLSPQSHPRGAHRHRRGQCVRPRVGHAHGINQVRKSKGSQMAQEALGLLECKGLVALIEGSDAMLKAANVEMMGWDKAGSGLVTAFVRGDVAAVKASLDAGAEAAGR